MVIRGNSRIFSTPRFLRHDSIKFILNTFRKPIQLFKVIKKVRDFTCVVYQTKDSVAFLAAVFVFCRPSSSIKPSFEDEMTLFAASSSNKPFFVDET